MCKICKCFEWICSCFGCQPKNEKSDRDLRQKKMIGMVTPSLVKDKDVTEEYKVPSDKYKFFDDVLKERGYDLTNKEVLYCRADGSTTVYSVNRYVDRKEVVIKENDLKGTDKQRDRKKFNYFKNEIFILSNIKHKNIVELMDHFIINNTTYEVMARAVWTLQEEIEKTGPMPEWKAKKCFLQIVRAVERLHMNRPPIAHRDIKLDNVLIYKQDREIILKLTDFGFSKVLSERHEKPYREKDGLGTLPYMSPQLLRLIVRGHAFEPEIKEQLGSVRTVNIIKADIWALGVCLYYMVNGVYPFDVTSDKNSLLLSVLELQDNKKYKPFKQNISEELKDLLNAMLEPNTTESTQRQYRINIIGVTKHEWLENVSEEIRI